MVCSVDILHDFTQRRFPRRPVTDLAPQKHIYPSDTSVKVSDEHCRLPRFRTATLSSLSVVYGTDSLWMTVRLEPTRTTPSLRARSVLFTTQPVGGSCRSYPSLVKGSGWKPDGST